MRSFRQALPPSLAFFSCLPFEKEVYASVPRALWTEIINLHGEPRQNYEEGLAIPIFAPPHFRLRSGPGATTPGWGKQLALSSTSPASGAAPSASSFLHAQTMHALLDSVSCNEPRICMIPVVVFSDGFIAKVVWAMAFHVANICSRGLDSMAYIDMMPMSKSKSSNFQTGGRNSERPGWRDVDDE